MEKLFNRWIALKDRIQNLAGAVQNPIGTLTAEEKVHMVTYNTEWEVEYANFVNEISSVADATRKFLIKVIK